MGPGCVRYPRPGNIWPQFFNCDGPFAGSFDSYAFATGYATGAARPLPDGLRRSLYGSAQGRLAAALCIDVV